MGILREILLRASRSRWLDDQIRRRRFVQRSVARFIPGEDLDSALGATKALQSRGISTFLTYLGENVTDPAEATAVADHYHTVLERVRVLGCDAHISVKLTQLGLDLEIAPAKAHLSGLLERAAQVGNFVWIDMEDHTYTDRTLSLFRELRASHANVGICLQAYLYRTERDLDEILSGNAAIRLVKGAYREPAGVAYRRKRDVDANYLRLATRLLGAVRADGVRPGFATHDLPLIREIQSRVQAAGVPRDAFEFQMLYGIQREAQARLAAEGYRVRVLISYGTAWFAWFMRRLAERPANLWFVARNLFVG